MQLGDMADRFEAAVEGGESIGVIVDGGLGGDVLHGSSLAGEGDSLDGGPGNDRLIGGSGDDHLYGGLGADDISGGAGRDITHFDESDPVTGLVQLRPGGVHVTLDDVTTGGPGQDWLIASGPGDLLRARDGQEDRLDCLDGGQAEHDWIDVVDGCTSSP